MLEVVTKEIRKQIRVHELENWTHVAECKWSRTLKMKMIRKFEDSFDVTWTFSASYERRSKIDKITGLAYNQSDDHLSLNDGKKSNMIDLMGVLFSSEI